MTKLISAGDQVGEQEIAGGTVDRVPVIAAEDFSYALAPEETVTTMLSLRSPVFAPVAEGEDAGFAYILLNGKAVDKIPVTYGRTSEQKQEEPQKSFRFLRKR